MTTQAKVNKGRMLEMVVFLETVAHDEAEVLELVSHICVTV